MQKKVINLDKKKQKELLEAFIADNSSLKKLEVLLNRFNFFEAIGATRQELRHSHFLAFLLDPKRNHELKGAFVKNFLMAVLIAAQAKGINSSVSLSDLNTWNFDNIKVYREWRHIDILAVNKEDRCVIIIENKIDAHEHSNQLRRYYQQVKYHFAAYRIIALYLTPDGDIPSESVYIPIDYNLICEVFDVILANSTSALHSDVLVILQHYVQILRRYVVNNSEITRLCRSIYVQHRQALSLIYTRYNDYRKMILKRLV